jgi:hypothetical protein
MSEEEPLKQLEDASITERLNDLYAEEDSALPRRSPNWASRC